jgi:ketosteroid isomerase-like protein
MATLAPLDVHAIFDRYATAWRAKDVDAIALLHTEDSEFRLRLDHPRA